MYGDDIDTTIPMLVPTRKIDKQARMQLISIEMNFPNTDERKKKPRSIQISLRGGQNEQVRSNCKLLVAGGVVVAVKSNWC